MSEAIEILMDEHRLIEQVLGSLETFAFNLQNGADADRQTVKDFGDFFSWLRRQVPPRQRRGPAFHQDEPVRVPRRTTARWRSCSPSMRKGGPMWASSSRSARERPLSPSERDAIIEHALAYIPLLRSHIIKEDNILYPMAIQAIPQAEMDAMLAEFKASEQTTEGEGEHDRFRAMAQALAQSYPPDPARMSAGAGCSGCTGHM